jgi:hypothetical protein
VKPANLDHLRHRVVSAAEAALAKQQYVSAIDVLTRMGSLEAEHLLQWRRGRIHYLERVIHLNLSRLNAAMKLCREWATARGLKPSETQYRRWGKGPKPDLRFSKSGDPTMEKCYRTHYVMPSKSGFTPDQGATELLSCRTAPDPGPAPQSSSDRVA